MTRRPAAGRVRRHRAAALFAALTGAAVQLGAPRAGSPGHHRAVVRSAARVLTALGVRVEVAMPAVPWPPTGQGRLVVANHVSWLDELALLTVVPCVPVAKAEIASWPVIARLAARIGVLLVDRERLRDLPGTVASAAERLRAGMTVLVHPEGTTTCGVELGRFRHAFFQAAVDAEVPVCPVAIRYRAEDEEATTIAAYVGKDPLWRSIARVLAARELVVEVHLLPALAVTGADRRTLAALAEYAIAEVTELLPPATAAHPRPRRVRPAPAGLRPVPDDRVAGLTFH